MTALRLARAATGREPFVRFRGNYHGHADPFLSEAGSGVRTLGIEAAAELESRRRTTISRRSSAWSTALPASSSSRSPGTWVSSSGRGASSRAFARLCDGSGVLLVFDEVITGFRVARGGAQERYGVLPDLTVLGKIVGGGLPLAAFGGRAELMKRLALAGDVYQAGTLSGNPLATAAGLSVLRRLTPGVYEELERKGQRSTHSASTAASSESVRWRRSSSTTTRRCFRHLLEHGIYLAPSPERGDVPLDGPRRGRDRPHDRGGRKLPQLSSSTTRPAGFSTTKIGASLGDYQVQPLRGRS